LNLTASVPAGANWQANVTLTSPCNVGTTSVNFNLATSAGQDCFDFAVSQVFGGCGNTSGAILFDSVACDPFVATKHFPAGLSGGFGGASCCDALDFTVTVTF
jgi:hypothetical protein